MASVSPRTVALGGFALAVAACGTAAEVGESPTEPSEQVDAGQPIRNPGSGTAPDVGIDIDDSGAPVADSGEVADAGVDAGDAGRVGPDSGRADAGRVPVSVHPLVDTMFLAGRWLPVYPVAASGDRVGFLRRGGRTELVDDADTRLWERDHGEGTFFGGFDFDEDGWVDFGLAKKRTMAERCGGREQHVTWIELFSGRTGDRITETAPLDPICWTFSSTTYPTSQWTQQSVLFGSAGAPVALFPVYATNAWFFRRDVGGTVRSHGMHYPSTAAFDRSYPNAQPNAWDGDDRAHLPNSHIANGLVLNEQGQYRALFFTSGRVVQYAHEPLGPNQLLADRPFVSRQNIAGRNYGLVELNEDEGRVVLVSGANILSVFRDHQRQVRGTDIHGGIERHVAIYDYRRNTIDNRFFSYSHDGGDTHQYRNRVVYPAHAWVGAPAGRSRIAFNVYDDARRAWALHVSEPGSTDDALVLPNLFLWDMRDVTGDGAREWIVSPADPDRSYFLRPETQIYRWNEAGRRLEQIEALTGLPMINTRFRTPTVTTSTGHLFAPALISTADGGVTVRTFQPPPP